MATALYDMFYTFVKEKKTTATKAFAAAGVDKMRALSLLNTNSIPPRDVLIRFALGLGLSPEEADAMLKECGHPTLEPLDGRDNFLIYALKFGGDINGLNEALAGQGFDKLSSL